MSKIRLSTGQVVVNNETLLIVPNSLTYDGGESEITVEAGSIGGGKVETVHGENVENAKSVVKFDVFTTADLDEKIRDWKSKIGENGISFVQRVGSTTETRTFTGMSLVNRVERGVGADGKTSLEFEGDPMET